MAGAVRLQTIESPDNDPTCVTYIMHGEDDTLGNSLRLELSKNFKNFFLHLNFQVEVFQLIAFPNKPLFSEKR